MAINIFVMTTIPLEPFATREPSLPVTRGGQPKKTINTAQAAENNHERNCIFFLESYLKMEAAMNSSDTGISP